MYILLELMLFGKPFNIDLTRNISYTEIQYHNLNINITFFIFREALWNRLRNEGKIKLKTRDLKVNRYLAGDRLSQHYYPYLKIIILSSLLLVLLLNNKGLYVVHKAHLSE